MPLAQAENITTKLIIILLYASDQTCMDPHTESEGLERYVFVLLFRLAKHMGTTIVIYVNTWEQPGQEGIAILACGERLIMPTRP